MIGKVYHLDRGFERIEDKLAQCGLRSSGCPTESLAICHLKAERAWLHPHAIAGWAPLHFEN